MIKSNQRITYHPVRGYATEQQYKKLQSMAPGIDKDRLIEQIKQQGKTKF